MGGLAMLASGGRRRARSRRINSRNYAAFEGIWSAIPIAVTQLSITALQFTTSCHSAPWLEPRWPDAGHDLCVSRYIHETTLNRAAIRRIQTMLPDDTELDAWLEQTATDYAGDEFLCLVIAALGAGRDVQARHLAKGAAALAAGDMVS
jgi:hypothetical protein